jgi:hypothetical protein
MWVIVRARLKVQGAGDRGLKTEIRDQTSEVSGRRHGAWSGRRRTEDRDQRSDIRGQGEEGSDINQDTGE